MSSVCKDLGMKKSAFAAKTQILQTKLASEGGSQCGYCSPGMVMQLHSWLQEHSATSELEIDNILDGNICRCSFPFNFPNI